MHTFSNYTNKYYYTDDKKYTFFIYEGGCYQFVVMPFGLRNAPATFHRTMSTILVDHVGRCVSVFVNDTGVFSRGWEEHLKDLRAVFSSMSKWNVKLKLAKCKFKAKGKP
eukprot:Rmarinus@m.7160